MYSNERVADLRVSGRRSGWLALTLDAIRCVGYCVVEDVLDASFLDETRDRMYAVREKILDDVGVERLQHAGELGVLRLMMKYDAHFLKFLAIPELLAVVDETVSSTAVMHLQNGFILPSFDGAETPDVFQNNFHPDFRRVLNGYTCSVNTLFAIDAFSADNGGTVVVPGSQQKAESPTREFMNASAVPLSSPAGSMIVFDSTLWHAAGQNTSGRDRIGINHQFTRSYFKQQIDYVRALRPGFVETQLPRTQQLLGYYTRVVTSLDEYYRPAEERLYRSGQG